MRLSRGAKIFLKAFLGAALAFGVRILADYLDSTLLAVVSTAAGAVCILIGFWAALFVPQVEAADDPSGNMRAFQRKSGFVFVGLLVVFAIFGQSESAIVQTLLRVVGITWFIWSAWSGLRLRW